MVTTAVFRRPPRREPPPLVGGHTDVRPPPTLPARQGGGMATVLVLLPALAGFGAMALIFASGGSGLHVAAGVLFGVSMLAVAVGQLARVGGDRARTITTSRQDYLRHLSRVREQARAAAADAQRRALTWAHPSPEALTSLARTSRLWERRPTDPDFGIVRIGVGDQQLSLDLPEPPAPPDDVDLVAAVALDRLLRAHRTVRELPVALPLRSLSTVRLEGNLPACRHVATPCCYRRSAGTHPPTCGWASACPRTPNPTNCGRGTG